MDSLPNFKSILIAENLVPSSPYFTVHIVCFYVPCLVGEQSRGAAIGELHVDNWTRARHRGAGVWIDPLCIRLIPYQQIH